MSGADCHMMKWQCTHVGKRRKSPWVPKGHTRATSPSPKPDLERPGITRKCSPVAWDATNTALLSTCFPLGNTVGSSFWHFGENNHDCCLHRRVHYVLRRIMDDGCRFSLSFVSISQPRCSERLAGNTGKSFPMDGAAVAGNRHRSCYRFTGLISSFLPLRPNREQDETFSGVTGVTASGGNGRDIAIWITLPAGSA
jgi:hypothetical protein